MSIHETTVSIINKWNAQKKFVRYIDGDLSNNEESNKCEVLLQEALQHFDDWVVDWFKNLTQEELQIVGNSNWRDGLSFNQSPIENYNQDQEQKEDINDASTGS